MTPTPRAILAHWFEAAGAMRLASFCLQFKGLGGTVGHARLVLADASVVTSCRLIRGPGALLSRICAPFGNMVQQRHGATV